MSADEWGRLRMLVALLLILQLVSVLLMWSLNPVSQQSQASFALLLAADLVAFSSISYLGRMQNVGGKIRGTLVLAGSAAVLLFMILAMTV